MHSSGRITGCEPLRWHESGSSLVPPSRFIPAEENGGIVKVGEWVLHEICRQLKQWSQEGLAPCIALNLSARQFYQRDLDVVMLHIVSDTGIDPSLIELEITESMLMNPSRPPASCTTSRMPACAFGRRFRHRIFQPQLLEAFRWMR